MTQIPVDILVLFTSTAALFVAALSLSRAGKRSRH